MIYSELLEVCKSGKVTQGAIVESQLAVGRIFEANTESLDERKQTELI